MSADAPEIGGGRRPGETEEQRLDRNLQELLGGLRVALPGVQVLFAFLLILPFQNEFSRVTSFQKAIFYATLICTALSSICLIAPSVRHRLRFRKEDKAWVVFSANRLAVAGLAFLGLAMTGVMVLISDFIFGATAAIAAGALTGLLTAWVWFGSPLSRELRRE
ncbi:MAG TPA: DUF6328 family protein [Solirubrobacterales bacterium]|jgi:hypothetical protein